jgi:hypothetical protein
VGGARAKKIDPFVIYMNIVLDFQSGEGQYMPDHWFVVLGKIDQKDAGLLSDSMVEYYEEVDGYLYNHTHHINDELLESLLMLGEAGIITVHDVRHKIDDILQLYSSGRTMIYRLLTGNA